MAKDIRKQASDNDATAKVASDSQPSFEHAMKRLEEIVEEMEEGELDLETLISRHEEGTQLVKLCNARLEDAQRRVAAIEETGSGVELTLFEPAPSPSTGISSPSPGRKSPRRNKPGETVAPGSEDSAETAEGSDSDGLF